MLNSPLAAPATADAQRLEMDQVRTTLSKQDPGQHRFDSRPSAATALATSIEREKLSVDGKACQLRTTFRWLGRRMRCFLQICTCRSCASLEVTKLARSQALSPSA